MKAILYILSVIATGLAPMFPDAAPFLYPLATFLAGLATKTPFAKP
jgi:hypothetical protein